MTVKSPPRQPTSRQADARRQEADTPRQRPLRLKIASWLRWLHTYLSMFSLMIILFFSATGVTLNHPDWFAGKGPVEKQVKGKLPAEWLAAGNADNTKVSRLEIVEYLRKENSVKGAMEEFRVDETECMVSFKAPSYSADAFIDRTTGTYQLTTMEEGAVAYLNDLHKGRHSGGVWPVLIDLSGIFLSVISLTGLGLIFYLKKIRTAALLTAVAGLIVLILIAKFLVP
jgi:hypothetical protein